MRLAAKDGSDDDFLDAFTRRTRAVVEVAHFWQAVGATGYWKLFPALDAFRNGA